MFAFLPVVSFLVIFLFGAGFLLPFHAFLPFDVLLFSLFYLLSLSFFFFFFLHFSLSFFSVRELAKSVLRWLNEPAALQEEREKAIGQRERFQMMAGDKARSKRAPRLLANDLFAFGAGAR